MTAALKVYDDRPAPKLAVRQPINTPPAAPLARRPSRAEVVQRQQAGKLAPISRSAPGQLAPRTAPGQLVTRPQAAQPKRAQMSRSQVVARQQAVVRSLPKTRTPNWLQTLIWAQLGTSVVTWMAIAVTLGIYGWTVYTQQLWGKEYRRVETLQRQERQFLAADETLKTQMAQQAELPGSNLVLPTADNTVFLQAPPQALTPAPKAPVTDSAPAQIPVRPMGY